ncbi:hypothetical protein B566_EDAN003803, partial [Ephemera danica]
MPNHILDTARVKRREGRRKREREREYRGYGAIRRTEELQLCGGGQDSAATMRSLYREVLGTPTPEVTPISELNTKDLIFCSTALKTPLMRAISDPQAREDPETVPPKAMVPRTPLQRRNSLLNRKNPVARSISSPTTLRECGTIRRHPVHRAPSRLYRPMGVASRIQSGSKYLCPRNCVGPEFVVRSSLPSKELILGDDKRVGKRRVLVVLLSGQRLDVLCYPSSVTAADILEAVVREEGLGDNFMLGLALLLSGDYVFLPPDTKLSKVAPPSWLLSIVHSTEPTTFTLYVRVQLYLTSLRGISLLEHRLCCPLTQHIALAGLSLQAEFGDYSQKEHADADYFLLEHYIPEELLSQSRSGGEEADLRWRLRAQHETRQGLDPGRAEENFISAVQRLPDHGIHFYHAHQSTKESMTPVQLGIKGSGILVYAVPTVQNLMEGQRQLLQEFEWRSIQKLSYNKQSFSLVCLGEAGKPLKLKFKLEDKKSVYVFHLASLHHQFSLRLRNNEVHSMQTLSREFGIVVSKRYCDSDMEERWSLRSSRQRGSGRGLSLQGSRQGSGREERQNKENECPNPPPSEDGTIRRPTVRMGTRAIYSSSQWSSKETLISDKQAYSPLPEAYIINASLKSQEEEFHLSYHENYTNTLTDKLGNMSLTEERLLRTIRLQKDSDGSLGIQVTEGSDGAVYIQSVVPNGAAYRQGIIKRGDQVIAVGGETLVNLSYPEALQVLQKALSGSETQEIELILSQVVTDDIVPAPCQVTAKYRKNRASLFPQSAVRLDIISTLQKPVEENYLRNIRYETSLESGEMISKLISASPNKSKEYKVVTSPSKEKIRAGCCVAPMIANMKLEMRTANTPPVPAPRSRKKMKVPPPPLPTNKKTAPPPPPVRLAPPPPPPSRAPKLPVTAPPKRSKKLSKCAEELQNMVNTVRPRLPSDPGPKPQDAFTPLASREQENCDEVQHCFESNFSDFKFAEDQFTVSPRKESYEKSHNNDIQQNFNEFTKHMLDNDYTFIETPPRKKVLKKIRGPSKDEEDAVLSHLDEVIKDELD